MKIPKLLETLNIRGLIFTVEFIDAENKVVTCIRRGAPVGALGLNQIVMSFDDFASIKKNDRKLLTVVRRCAA